MGLHLRPARAADYPHFVRWFPLLDSGDRVPSQAEWADRIAALSTLAVFDGLPIGYCYVQSFGEDGYVRNVVVEPAQRRRGVARALLEHATAQMREQGCTRWRLNVKLDNEPAVALYASMGLRVKHHCATMRFPWALLDRLPDPSGTLSVVEPDAKIRSELEAMFALPTGQLADAAGRDATHVRAVLGARPLALASFAVGFPGAFPFRAATTDAAFTLLHGLRPLAHANHMQIVVEDHPALDALMVEAGAQVAYRFAHMRGPL